MNVEVVRAKVGWIALQHGLQHADDFTGARRGLAVSVVELPGVQVHAAFGEKCGGVEVVWIPLVNFAHGVVIGGFELVVVGIRGVGVALGQRLDVVAFLCGAACGKRERLLDGGVGLFLSVC